MTAPPFVEEVRPEVVKKDEVPVIVVEEEKEYMRVIHGSISYFGYCLISKFVLIM